MKVSSLISIAAILLSGASVAEQYKLDHPPVPRPKWILVAKMINATSGEQLEERELHGTNEPEDGWDDPYDCVRAAIEMGPAPEHDGVVAVLTCKKIGPSETTT